MPDSTQSSDGVITRPSSKSVAQTIDGLRRLMADRGFTVFNVIDHSGVAGRAGVQMPDSKLVLFGKPAVGAAVMVAAPLAALDIPLKVLVWEDRNGAVSVSYTTHRGSWPGGTTSRVPCVRPSTRSRRSLRPTWCITCADQDGRRPPGDRRAISADPRLDPRRPALEPHHRPRGQEITSRYHS